MQLVRCIRLNVPQTGNTVSNMQCQNHGLCHSDKINDVITITLIIPGLRRMFKHNPLNWEFCLDTAVLLFTDNKAS